MDIKKGQVKNDPSRDLFWAKIIFSLPTGEKSQILTCASEEYLQNTFKSDQRTIINDQVKDSWLDSVINKWSVLGDEIFEQDMHYDVYMSEPESEKNGLAFLLNVLS